MSKKLARFGLRLLVLTGGFLAALSVAYNAESAPEIRDLVHRTLAEV